MLLFLIVSVPPYYPNSVVETRRVILLLAPQSTGGCSKAHLFKCSNMNLYSCHNALIPLYCFCPSIARPFARPLPAVARCRCTDTVYPGLQGYRSCQFTHKTTRLCLLFQVCPLSLFFGPLFILLARTSFFPWVLKFSWVILPCSLLI